MFDIKHIRFIFMNFIVIHRICIRLLRVCAISYYLLMLVSDNVIKTNKTNSRKNKGRTQNSKNSSNLKGFSVSFFFLLYSKHVCVFCIE